VDGGGSVVASSLVAVAFHGEAVVAGAFDDAGVAAVTDGVEVAFGGDLGGKFGTESVLAVRGKKRPVRRFDRR